MPHFEIHANDVEAAKTFYTGLFDWEYETMPGAEEMNYHLASGDQIGSDNGVTVGLMQRVDGPAKPGGPIRGGTMTFEVANCDKSYDWALNNGGGEALPPQDYPGIGRCAYVEDGQGNVVGIITPAESN